MEKFMFLCERVPGGMHVGVKTRLWRLWHMRINDKPEYKA